MKHTDTIRTLLDAALRAAQTAGSLPPFEPPTIGVERPKQAGHGDYSSNVAMVAAAAARKEGNNVNPRQIAQALVDHLPASDIIDGTEIAGPGFINLSLADAWLQDQVAVILTAGSAYGNIDRGVGQRWQVEYVSANPSGPIHYGGARNAVLGSALANVLEAAGYTIQREYYVNDGGSQFVAFVASLYARYLQQFGRDEPVPEKGYPGAYMIDYARRVVERVGDSLLAMDRDAALAAIRPIGRDIVLADLHEELSKIGVSFDNWFSEQSLYDEGLVQQALDYLDSRGEIARRDGAVWFLASNYPKNDKDEVVVRSNGAPTYFASDIAYHYDKFIRRGFDRVVNVWAVDHQGHVPRMNAMMQAFGLDPDRLVILMYDLVKLLRNGQEVKLSKRAGEIITIGEVVDDVGVDAVRFNLLTRSPESGIEFDLDLAVQQSNDNPVYYVQYGHARICSILARAVETGFDVDTISGAGGSLRLLTHPSELALLRKMIELEEQIDLAVDKLSPHNLTHYAIDLTRAFSAFYRDCKVIDADAPELSRARLQLSRACRVVVAKVLALIGVSAPASM